MYPSSFVLLYGRHVEQKMLDENVALREVILGQLTPKELEGLIGENDTDASFSVDRIRERFETNAPDSFDLQPNMVNLVQKLTLLKEEKEVRSKKTYHKYAKCKIKPQAVHHFGCYVGLLLASNTGRQSHTAQSCL